jgi:hypothetical protein
MSQVASPCELMTDFKKHASGSAARAMQIQMVRPYGESRQAEHMQWREREEYTVYRRRERALGGGVGIGC